METLVYLRVQRLGIRKILILAKSTWWRRETGGKAIVNEFYCDSQSWNNMYVLSGGKGGLWVLPKILIKRQPTE